jgi:hypothetical protein
VDPEVPPVRVTGIAHGVSQVGLRAGPGRSGALAAREPANQLRIELRVDFWRRYTPVVAPFDTHQLHPGGDNRFHQSKCWIFKKFYKLVGHGVALCW